MRQSGQSPGGPARWWAFPLVILCCSIVLLGAYPPLSPGRPAPESGHGDSAAISLRSGVASGDSSFVLGKICLSTGGYLSGGQSCPNTGLPEAVEWDASNGDILVSNYYGGENGTWVVSPTTGGVIATLPGGAGGGGYDGSAVDTANGDIYVPGGELGANYVEVYSGTNFTLLASIPVGANPDAALFDPATGDVYVVNGGSDNVSVIDSATEQVIANVPVVTGQVWPSDLTLDSANGDIYVTGMFNGAIVLNASTDRVVGNLSFRTYGTGTVWDPENGDLYVPNVNQDTLEVINTTTDKTVADPSIFMTYWSSGDDPVTAAFDPTTGYICVTNFFSNDISVVPGSTNALLAGIASGSPQWGIAFDPISGYGYASSAANDTVTVFATPPTYPVTFVETGLVPGTNWTVNTLVVGGVFYNVVVNTSQNSTTIAQPDGLVDVWISALNYTASPGRAVLNITGQPLRVPIEFTAVPVASAGSARAASTPGWEIAATVAAVLFAVALVVLTVRSRRNKRDGGGGGTGSSRSDPAYFNSGSEGQTPEQGEPPPL